ncbi:MAG TPA: hypothetical protein VG841_14500 [Caulobacterales bacterium]|nr:hypothetical protein [Caulobacterales bacterium]
MFAHITAAKLESAIRRAGLGRVRREMSGARLRRQAVFCFPVLESHTLTHQWTREVLKWRRQPLIAVYFRVPDNEPVLCGRFANPACAISAAEAVRVIRNHIEDPRGFEVIVQRAVAPREIHRIAPVRGVIGWRHYPDAHGCKPCGCPYCQRGEPNSRKLRQRYEAGEI